MLLALNKMLLNLFILHQRRVPVKGGFFLLGKYFCSDFFFKVMYGFECKNPYRCLQWHRKRE